MRLVDTLSRFFGRVEIALAGAEAALRDAEDALAQGDVLRARAQAHAVLRRVPGSPLGLALLADACEAGHLDAELAMTLEDLAARVPSRPEIWLRLARARKITQGSTEEIRDALLRGLAVAEGGIDARKELLLDLADLDLSLRDARRADLWLDRLGIDETEEVRLRRGESALLSGRMKEALDFLDSFGDSVENGRALLAVGRARAHHERSDAYVPLLRAYLLDTPGAADQLSDLLGHLPYPEALLPRIRVVVNEKGDATSPRWRAAFARAEGRRDEARNALRDALAHGDEGVAQALLVAAIDDRDAQALRDAVARIDDHSAPHVRDAVAWLDVLAKSSDEAHFETIVAGLTTPALKPWVDDVARQNLSARIPALPAPAKWDAILARLDTLARRAPDLDVLSTIADLSLRRMRPIKVAIVGEFNAGKSTFINALLGADIAPTGILPTTGTLHHLRYGQDPIAKIFFHAATAGEAPQSERIVAARDLRRALSECDTSLVAGVEILEPLVSLTRVEILDTPGFNAPDPRHAEAARAAFAECDFAIWLLDASQALKNTEREVLLEAQKLRLPVQIMINKADRLKPEDLEHVKRVVIAELFASGLRSWSAPVAFSAKLALAGKLGQEGALATSNWIAVEELLESRILGESHTLKEASLRRRTAPIARALGQTWQRIANEHAAETALRREDAVKRKRAAVHIESEESALARELEKALKPGKKALDEDLAMVLTGRERTKGEPDMTVERYRAFRALAHLTAPLGAFWVQSALPAKLDANALARLAEASVRTLAASYERNAELGAFCRAAMATLLAYLEVTSEASGQSPRAELRATELTRLAEALADRDTVSA